MNLNEKLKRLRSEKNMTQNDVAKILKVDRSTYAKYETGDSSPDYEKLLTLSRIFNCSTDYLLGRDITKKPELSPHYDEVEELLETLHKRPEMKALFSLTKKATKEDIERAMKIIEMFKGE